MSQDDDIGLLKSKKMLERWTKIGTDSKNEQLEVQERNDRELVISYLYKMGEDVLVLAESQFPNETKRIVHELAELIKIGKINQRISGKELLALFKSRNLYLKINTSIKIEDHGKMLSFSEKLRNDYEDAKNQS
jgi:hypothetical protein